MQELQKDKYIDHLRKTLHSFYLAESEKTPDGGLKQRLNGYLEAVIILGVMDKEELQAIIDEEHHLAFGMTIRERRLDKTSAANGEIDWDYFDAPAWARNRQ